MFLLAKTRWDLSGFHYRKWKLIFWLLFYFLSLFLLTVFYHHDLLYLFWWGWWFWLLAFSWFMILVRILFFSYLLVWLIGVLSLFRSLSHLSWRFLTNGSFVNILIALRFLQFCKNTFWKYFFFPVFVIFLKLRKPCKYGIRIHVWTPLSLRSFLSLNFTSLGTLLFFWLLKNFLLFNYCLFWFRLC